MPPKLSVQQDTKKTDNAKDGGRQQTNTNSCLVCQNTLVNIYINLLSEFDLMLTEVHCFYN